MVAWFHQVFLTQHSQTQIGLRTHREMLTLCLSIDMLTAGTLGELGDLLVQRLKALERSVVDGGWHMAKHQELIQKSDAVLTQDDEVDVTAKAELRALKLKEALEKVKKRRET